MKSTNEIDLDQIPVPKRKVGRKPFEQPMKLITVHVTQVQAKFILEKFGKFSHGVREMLDFYLAEHADSTKVHEETEALTWEPSQNVTGEVD